MKITLGDANHIGDCYEQFGCCEARFLRLPYPGEVTYVDVPAGFYWTMTPPDILKIYPRWWRRALRAMSGRWSIA